MSANADYADPQFTFFVDSEGRAVLLPRCNPGGRGGDSLFDSRHAVTFALARGMHDALRARDWSAIVPMLADNVSWVWPAGNSICHELHGAAQVIVQLRRIVRAGASLRCGDVLISRDSFALALRLGQTARPGELVSDRYAALVCGIAGRRIDAMATYARLEENRAWNEFSA